MINLSLEFKIQTEITFFVVLPLFAGRLRSPANWFYDARAPETINVSVFVVIVREGAFVQALVRYILTSYLMSLYLACLAAHLIS